MLATTRDPAEFPESPYYVMARDTFMSGWGEADGLDNWVVFCAATLREALDIEWKLIARPEMASIRRLSSRPKRQPEVVYSIITREDGLWWYES